MFQDKLIPTWQHKDHTEFFGKLASEITHRSAVIRKQKSSMCPVFLICLLLLIILGNLLCIYCAVYSKMLVLFIITAKHFSNKKNSNLCRFHNCPACRIIILIILIFLSMFLTHGRLCCTNLCYNRKTSWRVKARNTTCKTSVTKGWMSGLKWFITSLKVFKVSAVSVQVSVSIS